MRCKVGDLAIMVKSWAGNEGKIVKCVRLATQQEINNANYPNLSPVWVIDRALPTQLGNLYPLVMDLYLRPIRPSEGQDETLSWKDVPHEELA